MIVREKRFRSRGGAFAAQVFNAADG